MFFSDPLHSKNQNNPSPYNYGSAQRLLSNYCHQHGSYGTNGQLLKNNWENLTFTALIDKLRLCGHVRFRPEFKSSFRKCSNGIGYFSKKLGIWTSLWPGKIPPQSQNTRYSKLNPSHFSNVNGLLAFIFQVFEIQHLDELKISSIDVTLDINCEHELILQHLNFKRSLKYQTFGEHGQTETLNAGRARGGRRAKTRTYNKSKEMRDVRNIEIPARTRIEKQVSCSKTPLSEISVIGQLDYFEHISLCNYGVKNNLTDEKREIAKMFNSLRVEYGPWAFRRRLKHNYGYEYKTLDKVIVVEDLKVPLSEIWKSQISYFFEGGNNAQ